MDRQSHHSCLQIDSNRENTSLHLMKNSYKVLLKLYSDLPFSSERIKFEKFEKFDCNLHGKKNYAMHLRAPKQSLDHGLKSCLHSFIYIFILYRKITICIPFMLSKSN